MTTQELFQTPEYLEELQTCAANQESCRRVALTHFSEVILSLPDPAGFLNELQRKVAQGLSDRACIGFDGQPSVFQP